MNRPAFHRQLLERKQTIAVAESCTGGLLGAALSQHGGASGYFLGGVLTYSNALKQKLLGVPEEVLATHGAVSEECALAMAEGARRLAGADWALAVTGIAGPGGAVEGKPVGTVYVGLASPGGVRARRFQLEGDRAAIRAGSVAEALAWLEAELTGP